MESSDSATGGIPKSRDRDQDAASGEMEDGQQSAVEAGECAYEDSLQEGRSSTDSDVEDDISEFSDSSEEEDGMKKGYPVGTKVRTHFVTCGWCTGTVIYRDDVHEEEDYHYGSDIRYSNGYVERGVADEAMEQLVGDYKEYRRKERNRDGSAPQQSSSIFQSLCPNEDQLTIEEKAFLKSFDLPEAVESSSNGIVVPDGAFSWCGNTVGLSGASDSVAKLEEEEFHAEAKYQDSLERAEAKYQDSSERELALEDIRLHRKNIHEGRVKLLGLQQRCGALKSRHEKLQGEISGVKERIKSSLERLGKRNSLRGVVIGNCEPLVKKRKQT